MTRIQIRATDAWIGTSFCIGASCFLIGGASASIAAGWELLVPRVLNGLFAIGAVFFTLAAWGQYLQAVNAPRSDPTASGIERAAPRQAWRWFGVRAKRLGWWASVVQLAGTLMFNLMTIDALGPGLLGLRADLVVWSPDMIGSVCFLVASQLAVMDLCRHPWCWQWRSRVWWIAILNLAGAVAFQISAFFGWYRPGMTVPLGPWWDNYWTFVGALCFLIGAILLLPIVSRRRQANH